MINFSEYSYSIDNHNAKDRKLAIGHFDGCHIGHLQLFKEVGSPLSIVSFYPRPEVLLKKELNAKYLFSRAQKVRALKELKVQAFFEILFDEVLAQSSAEAFVHEIIETTRPMKLYAGRDFRFGKGRLGSLDTFRQLYPKLAVNSVELVTDGVHQKIGSGSIRRLLQLDGDVKQAAEKLGRYYLYESQTVEGQKLGRTIGIPTLNLSPAFDQVVPKNGTYVGYLTVSSEPSIFTVDTDFPCVINIGTNPTITSDDSIKIEAHVIKRFAPNEYYGKKIGLYFVDRLREEQKFASLNNLKCQINFDIEAASRILSLS